MSEEALDLTRQTLRSKDRANMWLGIGLIISLIFNGITLAQNQNDARHNREDARHNTELINEINASRAARNVSLCIQTNVATKGTRDALVGGVDGLLALSTDLTPEQVATIRATYQAAVDAQLPYRDCSPKGIQAYLDNPPADPSVTK